MLAFRSLKYSRSALGAVALAALAAYVGACAVGCGGDNSSISTPLVDASVGGHDSAGQEPSGDAGETDSTVGSPPGEDAAAGNDGGPGKTGEDSGSGTGADASGSTPGDAGDAGTGKDSGGGSEGGTFDSGAPDSSTPADAGSGDGGAVGTIPCGTDNCTVSSQVCCYGGGAAMPSCTAIGGCTGTPIDCRGTANCQGGDICCLDRSGGGISATCTASASCNGLRLCAADGDCATGYTCPRGFCVPPAPDGGFPVFDGGFPGFDGGFRGFDGGFPFPGH